MNYFTSFLIPVILLGLGATLTFDFWGLFLKYVFKIAPSNICLVGRWLRYMPEGTFRHPNISSSPPRRAECVVGWVAHYSIGITFATIFAAIVGNQWLQQPTLIPAILFGFVTVFAPFFIMQPAFGLGIAAAKVPKPAQARFKSLMNHGAFGLGLYFFGLLISWML